jgi:hypothetical protein
VKEELIERRGEKNWHIRATHNSERDRAYSCKTSERDSEREGERGLSNAPSVIHAHVFLSLYGVSLR